MADKSIIESVDKTKKEVEGQARDILGRDLDIHFVGNKDPNFVYRWLNTHKQNLETKKIRGWEIVQDKSIKTLDGSGESTHKIGDLILARMPKGKYEKMVAERKRLGDERRKVVKRRFREEAEIEGVKTFDRD